MFIVEWLFDKMGYQKKIQWTSSSLVWEDIEKACPELDKKKPVKKVATKRTTTAKKTQRSGVVKSPRKKA